MSMRVVHSYLSSTHKVNKVDDLVEVEKVHELIKMSMPG